MTDVKKLAERVQERNVTVAVAESLTSGLLASAIGAGESASEWFAGGVVSYFTEVKERVLGLEPGTDPCSATCAEQLAGGVRDLLKADIAVATTGVGGPDPDGGHAPGTVYLGWATGEDRGHVLLTLDGEPKEVLDQTVEAAVALLIERVERA